MLRDRALLPAALGLLPSPASTSAAPRGRAVPLVLGPEREEGGGLPLSLDTVLASLGADMPTPTPVDTTERAEAAPAPACVRVACARVYESV